jgi:hypothetical protein
MKTMICRKSSFQKLTQFSQGINMQDAAALNINTFFGEIHELLPLSSIVLIGRK